MKHYRVIIISTVYLLLICVYFPTNYHTSASCDAFIDVLSELEDFIDSVPFQHTIIEAILMLISLHITILFLKDFFHERNFICIALLPSSCIDHTYESDASGTHSWINQLCL